MSKRKSQQRQSGFIRWFQHHPDLALCIGIALLVYGFFAPVIFGVGTFIPPDMVTSFSLRPYVQAVEARGEYPQWIPYIFSGMPSYAALLVTGTRWWDFLAMLVFGVAKLIGDILASDTARVATYYVIYGIGMYWLMRSKQHHRFVAAFTAIAAVFSTFIIVWVMIGHNTKPAALMTYPYILLLLERLQNQRFQWLFALLMIGALHILAESSHMQLIFYAMLTFGLYLLVELLAAFRQRRSVWLPLRAGLWMAIAAVIAVGMTADRYLSVREYTPYSTRGSASILAKDSASTGGLDYDYATNWSFSPEETITFFIPNFFGFGKLPYKGPLTNNREVHLHTYWGQMPFTDAANYMGIGVLLLAIIGIILYRKEPLIWFLVALSLLSLFLSFGKNFPIVYDLFFYYVPLFNKFRTPSMALVMLQFAVPILAGYGITGIVQGIQRKEQYATVLKLLRGMLLFALVFFAAGLLFALIGRDFYIQMIEHSPMGKQLVGGLKQFIYRSMITDWFVTALIAIGFAATFLAYARKRIRPQWFLILLFALLIFDLWRVARRPMEIPDKSLEETVFRETDVIRFLKQDTTLFRIVDFTDPSPNYPAYFFLHHIHGYSSAKMRVYQDLMDVAGQGGGNAILNPFLWNLLNVKYVIVDRKITLPTLRLVAQSQEKRALVYQNLATLPRAFFVDSVVVAQPLEILEHLRDGDFNPRALAFVEQPLDQPIEAGADNANVRIIEYTEHRIILETRSQAPHFLFLSEPYYPPAWHATIDGQKAPIYKANYAFRGLVVPAGSHRIELWYYSESFATGKTISLSLNLLFIVAFIVVYR